jgi:hypothetical protein
VKLFILYRKTEASTGISKEANHGGIAERQSVFACLVNRMQDRITKKK